MAVPNSWVAGQVAAIPVPQFCCSSGFLSNTNNNNNNKSVKFNPGCLVTSLSLQSKASTRNRRLCCSCGENNSTTSVDSSSSSSLSSLEWDWSQWSRHFSEIEQAETFSSVLKFQLEDAIEKEDFQEAVKLKMAIAEATSKDTVGEIMAQLKVAIEEERYHDASKLCKHTGSGLVGWWVGYPKDSDDPFGTIVRITPSVGRFVGRTYSPRELVAASPGRPLFEIFVVRDADGAYVMQVVYMQQAKANSTVVPSKPEKGSSTPEVDKTTVVDVQKNDDKVESSEEKGLNIEGATEEGIKSVINFLKKKLPGLKVKVMNVDVAKKAMEDDISVNRLMQENSENSESDENSEDEVDSSDEIQPDEVTLVESSDTTDDEKDLDMKLFIGEIVHNEDTTTKDEYVRCPAEIKDMERESFLLHIPGGSLDHDTRQSKSSKIKVAAQAAKTVSELMPSDVAKAFWNSDKLSPKVTKNMRDIVKLAVSQANKRKTVSQYTTFNRISTSRGDLDPFEGLYVGSFGPYGPEVVQLRRRYGHWNGSDDRDDSGNVEFFEYVEAVKLTGDLNVPAGQVTFRAKIGRGKRLSNRGMYPDELGVVASYKGQGRIAELGFRNPKWVEGELLQLNAKGIGPYARGADLGFLYIVPEQSFLVLFNRLKLPE
ncbi:protein EXECUTER 2, chloroplastic [Argentina anserina]|uniref:protein EXECUTER 2, chloroplastic n=1 Tax=Argentina anserina TaxID=57926 RepID=UPI00217679D0|nr:protein EXECUTER 2, chloroplastic [Potentilla anserina]